MNVGRGGGGHGGHGHGHGGVFYSAAPWVYDDWTDYGDDDPRIRRRVVGQELLTSGEGALIVLGLIWYLVHEADKRVPR